MALLSEAEVNQALERLPHWQLEEGKMIRRDYQFDDYLTGVDFVRQIANQAEAKDHHPYVIIDHTTVTIKWMTVDQGGLTQKDTAMAEYCDELFGVK
ncbi:4a-hydroxytetrahydrobiopterin dehydratase [Alkalibacillus flavidus]|uniref:4a-hydroxytetrahydrobiopterin dehydratase n=1 Tax=Alkalibacillus flavidus TaxID=546021 RepID=A0ABV2KT46_9BACI